MAIIRQDRIGNENITSVEDIEQYISLNYLQIIQNKINNLKLKKEEIDNKIALYNSLNNTNNLLINKITTDIKYTTIFNNQRVIKPLLDQLNTILKNLNILLSYKNSITLNNLSYKEVLYSSNKVAVTDGEFEELEVETPISSKSAINKEFLIQELQKLEQPPLPLQPLKYLATDSAGNLIWQ